MLSCVSAAAATDRGGGKAAREFPAGRLAESTAHRRAVPVLVLCKVCRSGRVVKKATCNCGRTHQTSMKGRSVSSRSTTHRLNAPPFQWTSPHPTVNTSTEYSLARATQFHCDSPSARPCIYLHDCVFVCCLCGAGVALRRGAQGVARRARSLYLYL
jgi:hypothetical protein